MNEARRKVEEFKKKSQFEFLGRAELDVELPEDFESLDYQPKNKAYEEALDKAIAKHLGVELTDEKTWIEDRNKEMAREWAQTLPDKKG